MIRRLLLVIVYLVLGSPAWADYLILSRAAHVRAEPDGDSPSLYHLDRGAVLLLLEDDQTDRYYHAEPAGGGHAGWVYSTLGRRYRGSPSLPATPTTPPLTPSPTPAGASPALNDASAFPIPGCREEGKSTSPTRIQALNRLKNRLVGPPPQAVRATTLAAVLSPGADETRWSDQDGVELVGYVTKIKAMGPESCNCDSPDPQYRDVHIELERGPNDAGLPMVVEVTPQWKHLMASAGKDWSATGLTSAILNRWVRVRGWMMYDRHHWHNAANTNPDGEELHRQTAWEIHPVTAIEVVPAPVP